MREPTPKMNRFQRLHKRTIVTCLTFLLSSISWAFEVAAIIPFLPIPKNISLGMSVDEFRTIHNKPIPIAKNEFEANGERAAHIYFEEGDIEDFNNIEKSTERGNVQYAFLEGKLTQVEWQVSGVFISQESVNSYISYFEKNFTPLPPLKKRFIARKMATPYYETVQNRYRTQDGIVISVIANKIQMIIAATDVSYLKSIGKENYFDQYSENSAIEEYDKEQNFTQHFPASVVDDFLNTVSKKKDDMIPPEITTSENALNATQRTNQKPNNTSNSPTFSSKSSLLYSLAAILAILFGAWWWKKK